MLTCRNGLGIYVFCNGKRLTVYRSVFLHNDSLWISSYYFSYFVINDRRDKVTPLRKENSFITLLRNSRFRRIWFSRFLRTTTCRTFRSHPCRDDSVSYATHRFIIAVDNKNKRPQNYTFLCMFVALIGVMLVISKGNIHLLFELPVTSQQIYLCYAALLAGSFIQTVVLVFNLGHHSDIRR